jgi:hypothetical protein
LKSSIPIRVRGAPGTQPISDNSPPNPAPDVGAAISVMDRSGNARHTVATVSGRVLSSRKAGSMTSRTLRITATLIIIQSLLFFPPSVSRAQTQAEAKQAKEAADLFMKLLDETGDFSYVIDEMYAGDFIERYLQQKIRESEESNSSSDIEFAFGIRYKRDLLRQATIEDWWRFYIATNNFDYHISVIYLNKSAEDILNDREPDDENPIPPKLIALFDNQPALKGLIGIGKNDEPEASKPAEEPEGDGTEKEEEPEGDVAEKEQEPQADATEKKSGRKPIETPVEMRSVTETFQEGLRLLLEEYGDQSSKLTDLAKKAIETKIPAERMKPWVYVSDKEVFGFPAGVPLLVVPTPLLFKLILGEINGKQRIIWVDQFIPSCSYRGPS